MSAVTSDAILIYWRSSARIVSPVLAVSNVPSVMSGLSGQDSESYHLYLIGVIIPFSIILKSRSRCLPRAIAFLFEMAVRLAKK